MTCEYYWEQNSSARSHIPLRAERVKHQSYLDFNAHLTTILPRNVVYLPPSSAERVDLGGRRIIKKKSPTSKKNIMGASSTLSLLCTNQRTPWRTSTKIA